MRDLSKQNDPGAPIESTAEQRRSIEGRNDMKSSREDLRLAKLGENKEEIAEAKGALDQRRRGLCNLLVMDAREKYFAEANKLRSEGRSTDELQERSRLSNKRSDHAKLDIGGLMQLWTGEAGFGNRDGTSEELVFDVEAEDRSEEAMVWLLRYVNKEWSLLTLTPPVSTIPAYHGPKKPTRPRKAISTKRKREDRDTKASIPGVLVLDVSGGVSRKRVRKEENTSPLAKAESMCFSDAPVRRLET